MISAGSHKKWVIVPTYNEAQNVVRLIPAVLEQGEQFAILIVDDGSPDQTADKAQAFARIYPERVAILRRQRKEGYGPAVFAGMARAAELGADKIFTMDCDFSHDPKSLPRLDLQLEQSDVAVGSRYVLGGRTINWPVRRKVMSALANRLARTVVGLPTHDCTGGFRGYRLPVIRALLKQRVQSSSYVFLIETLFLAHRLGFSIGEIPIVFKEREFGQSKVDSRLIATAMLNLSKIGLRRVLGEQPTKQ
ncbi:MAG: polyprenol monophosphomannose synthase [Parcubacteria group bacterium]